MAKKISKIISWVLLVLTILSIGLMLRRPGGAKPAVDPEAARSFDEKLGELATAHERGSPSKVRLTEAEVNSKIQQTLAGAAASGPVSLSGVAVQLEGERLECVLTIKVLGLNTYITLGGKPSVRDHRLEFDLTKVKMGGMPVPASMVASALREKLDSPEMQGVTTLPDFLKDVRVENSELVIGSQ